MSGRGSVRRSAVAGVTPQASVAACESTVARRPRPRQAELAARGRRGAGPRPGPSSAATASPGTLPAVTRCSVAAEGRPGGTRTRTRWTSSPAGAATLDLHDQPQTAPAADGVADSVSRPGQATAAPCRPGC